MCQVSNVTPIPCIGDVNMREYINNNDERSSNS